MLKSKFKDLKKFLSIQKNLEKEFSELEQHNFLRETGSAPPDNLIYGTTF